MIDEMSGFWQGWIVVLTVANILACFWLIWWTMRKRKGEAAQGDVTGHTWDGDLQEYNNPLPRWWLWLFYGTLVFGILYYILYPGLWEGVLGWTKENQYQAEVERAEAKYGPIYAQYRDVPVPALAKNDDAVGMGKRLYLTYCMQCHGSDARGSAGFPNLADNVWQWGAQPDAIKTSIVDGRNAVMPGWKAVIGEDGAEQVTAYVMKISGRDADPQKAAQGEKLFNQNCVACHGADGTGNTALGAPDLTDDYWLYGGSPGVILKTLLEGRNGQMPAWGDELSGDKIHLLTAYVYSLSD